MDERKCSGPCGLTLPLAQFAKDARLKSGHRARCKRCDRAATADRRRYERVGRKPGNLCVVLDFPAPPQDPSPQDADAEASSNPTRQPGGAGNTTYADAAEAFIAALVPPAGDADALLVRSLRGLADLADRFSYGTDVVKDVNQLVASMVRVQRELAATRAAKSKAARAEEKPAPRSAANY